MFLLFVGQDKLVGGSITALTRVKDHTSKLVLNLGAVGSDNSRTKQLGVKSLVGTLTIL